MNEETKKHIKGYLYLFGGVSLCMIAPFIIKLIYVEDASKYNKPLFIVYFCTSIYIIYAIPILLRKFLTKKDVKKELIQTNDIISSHWEIIKLAFIVQGVSTVHSYLYTLAILKTSVVSNMIIHDTSDSFIFVMCLFLLGWKFSWCRLTSVMVGNIGLMFVIMSDASDIKQASPIFGDCISIISTMFYGLTLTLAKKYIEDEDAIDWFYYYFYTGVMALIIGLPFLILWHYTGIEPFEWPSKTTLIFLAIEGISGYILTDYLLNLATVILDPLLVDIGMGLISPGGMVIDYIMEGKTYDYFYIIGYGLIVVSFLIVFYYDIMFTIPDEIEKKQNQVEDEKNKELEESLK